MPRRWLGTWLSWWPPARLLRLEGTISTVVGRGSGYTGDGGPAVDAGLDGPRMIAFDAAGSLYIVDTNNSRVRKVS